MGWYKNKTTGLIFEIDDGDVALKNKDLEPIESPIVDAVDTVPTEVSEQTVVIDQDTTSVEQPEQAEKPVQRATRARKES
jgi:hypothetical protein